MTSPQVEAQARRHLRLFPVWMRDVRGEEVVGIVLDQVPAGADRLPIRSRLDLTRAGLHARRRGTPPWRVWRKVANAGRMNVDAGVPVAWRPWLTSQINRGSFLAACTFVRYWLGFVYVGGMVAFQVFAADPIGGFLTRVAAAALAVTVATFLAARRARRAQWRGALLAANGLGANGRPLPPHQVVVAWGKAAVSNAWVWPMLVASGVVGGVYGPVAWVGHNPTPRAVPLGASVLVVASFVGASLAWSGRRLAGLAVAGPAADSPPRPSDFLTTAGWVAAGGCLGLLWASMIASFGSDVGIGLSLVLSGPAAAAGVAGQAWRAERRWGRPIGLWDLVPSWAPHLVARAAPPDGDDPTSVGPSTPALG